MTQRTRLEDVEIAVAAAGLEPDGVDAILVGLLRALAHKIDSAGDDGPSDRVLAAYVSAQKDLARTIAARQRAAEVALRRAAPSSQSEPGAGPTEPPKLRAVEESPLDRIRRKKSRAAG